MKFFDFFNHHLKSNPLPSEDAYEEFFLTYLFKSNNMPFKMLRVDGNFYQVKAKKEEVYTSFPLFEIDGKKWVFSTDSMHEFDEKWFQDLSLDLYIKEKGSITVPILFKSTISIEEDSEYQSSLNIGSQVSIKPEFATWTAEFQKAYLDFSLMESNSNKAKTPRI